MSTSTKIRISLPILHPGQESLKSSSSRFTVVACGRRWGKTVYGIDRLVEPALKGFPVGWFAPNYKLLTEVWRDFNRYLAPAIKAANYTEKRIELITGGVIEFWQIGDPDAGRSRKYKDIVVDEAAKAPHLRKAWNEGIRPTLVDMKGSALFLSTPRGRDFFWELYTKGQDQFEPEWSSWCMPTVSNPYIDPAEIEDARRQLPERSFQQEFLAAFLEDGGGVFRNVVDAIDRGRTDNEDRRNVGSYSLGVDLARKEDFTVLTVVDNTGKQVYFDRFNQISWERQFAAIQTVSEKYRAPVFVDGTGLGDPPVERLINMGLDVRPFIFTNASKNGVINALAIKFERGELRLMDVPDQTNELIAYEYEISKARNITTNAPEGMHDDCVIALALAVHGATEVGSGGWGVW